MVLVLGVIAISAVFGIALPIHGYFPYFGLWDESKIFEELDYSKIMSRAETLEEVQLLLQKYPDAKISIDREHSQVKYVVEKTVKTRYGDEDRKLKMQIQFDVLGNPSPYIIGCSGNNVAIAGVDDIMEQLKSDWCFKGILISTED